MASVDDLATLPELDENNILKNLQKRYEQDAIYTYIGDILIAVNPYKVVDIYGTEQRQKYKKVGLRSSLPPHIFAISDAAYHSMLRNAANQCCVVSGESGAGKTESTKLLIQHIADLCRNDTSDLNRRIVQVSPLMEAFGNAQTVLNYNSSRFGKYIELMFDEGGQLHGAKISEYLLEKSRVVSHGGGERNFHIFYYLFAGLDEDRVKANLLKTPEEHRIIQTTGSGSVFASKAELDHCKAQWDAVMELMTTLGFSSKDEGHVTVDGILAILAAILHISDIEFVLDSQTDGVYIRDDNALVLASQLLAVNYEKLLEALISTTSTVGGSDETVTSLKTVSQANDGRDALAKALYGRLFSWIIYQINDNLRNKDNLVSTTIGILDIYGFENFADNSFEQLCINITNEQLQFFFNEHIFRWELFEYANEGISGADINYVDNKQLLDFFLEPLKPMGVFALLDDESRVPCGTDVGFVDKLTKAFPNLPDFKRRSKGKQFEFTIQHFAGQVTYNVDGFLEKNRDSLSENIMSCMKCSDARLVFELFSPVTDFGQLELKKYTTIKRFNRKSRMFLNIPDFTAKTNSNAVMNRLSRMISEGGRLSSAPTRRSNLQTVRVTSESGEGRYAKLKSLGNQFKNSLSSLMNQLSMAQPHFIRCVKPNAVKAANVFNHDLVTQQLRYTGVLETVKIRKQGYPTRLTFADFIHRYRFVNSMVTSDSPQDSTTCRRILESIGLKQWQIGHTKVFLRYHHVEQLNVKLAEFEHRVSVCQKYVRSFIARRSYERLLAAVKVYQDEVQSLAVLVRGISDGAIHCQRCLQEEDTQRRLQQQQEREAQNKMPNQTATVAPLRAKRIQRKVPDPSALSIPEDFVPESVCPANCQCSWKDFIKNPDQFASQSGVPPTLQTLLGDTLPKLPSIQNYIWAKMYLMEKNAIIGKFYLSGSEVIVNDSAVTYTGHVCGLKNSSFHHQLQDRQVASALENVKEGVKLVLERDYSVSMIRESAGSVTVRVDSGPQSLSREIVSAKGVLERNSSIKVFDISEFKRRLADQVKQQSTCNPYLCTSLSTFSFTFGQHCAIDTDSPLWMVVVNFSALDLIGNVKVLKEILHSSPTSMSLLEENILKKNWQHLDFKRSEPQCD